MIGVRFSSPSSMPLLEEAEEDECVYVHVGEEKRRGRRSEGRKREGERRGGRGEEKGGEEEGRRRERREGRKRGGEREEECGEGREDRLLNELEIMNTLPL